MERSDFNQYSIYNIQLRFKNGVLRHFTEFCRWRFILALSGRQAMSTMACSEPAGVRMPAGAWFLEFRNPQSAIRNRKRPHGRTTNLSAFVATVKVSCSSLPVPAENNASMGARVESGT